MRLGTHHSEEAKQKMAAKASGKVASEETREKLAALWRGRKHGEAAKEKLRKFHTGMKASSEAKANMSKAQMGKKLPPETVAKMVKYRTGRKLSEETKAKIAHTHKTKGISVGRIAWNKGKGKGDVHRRFRDSKENKRWRWSVFVRDNFTCQHCGATPGNGKRVNLEADHIKPYCLFPELKLELDNGRTLCKPCHRKTDTFGKNRKQLSNLFGITLLKPAI